MGGRWAVCKDGSSLAGLLGCWRAGAAGAPLGVGEGGEVLSCRLLALLEGTRGEEILRGRWEGRGRGEREGIGRRLVECKLLTVEIGVPVKVWLLLEV